MFLEWANGASTEFSIDWNKVGKPVKKHRQNDNESRVSLREGMKNMLQKMSSKDSEDSFDGSMNISDSKQWVNYPISPEKFVTARISNHIALGENLLEIVYQGEK